MFIMVTSSSIISIILSISHSFDSKCNFGAVSTSSHRHHMFLDIGGNFVLLFVIAVNENILDEILYISAHGKAYVAILV